MIMCNPDILPRKSDPQGSTRYEDVNIIHEQIECHFRKVNYYDDIDKNNTLIIEDLSPEYDGYECHMFKGSVLKELNNTYSWWQAIK